MCARIIYLLVVSILISISCKPINCSELSTSFTTYDNAISQVESVKWNFNQVIDSPQSSWINSASYYSCDDKTGYLIYKTKKGKEYIHKSVPISVWYDLEKAESKGKYIRSNLTGNYQLKLSK